MPMVQNSLIIYLWHAKKLLDYCLPYFAGCIPACLCVCVFDRYSRFILSRKCQMHNENNSQFWCNWQGKKGCQAHPGCQRGCSGVKGAALCVCVRVLGHHKMSNSVGCRNARQHLDKMLSYLTGHFGHDTRRTAATAQRQQRSLI